MHMRKGIIIPAALLLLSGMQSESFAGFSYDGASPVSDTQVRALPAGGTISFQPEDGGNTFPTTNEAVSAPVVSSGGISPVPAGNGDIQQAIEEAKRKRQASIQSPASPPSRPASSRSTTERRKHRKTIPVTSAPVASRSSAPQPMTATTSIASSSTVPNGTALSLHKGSLREQLERFCKYNGSQLAWHASNDIIINNETYFDGNGFQETLKQLFEALNVSGHYFKAEYFSGNNLLLVDDMRK